MCITHKFYDSILNLFIKNIVKKKKNLLSVSVFKNKECKNRAQRDTCERSAVACYCVFRAAAPPQRLARGRRGVQGGDKGAPDYPRAAENGNVMAADAGRGR